MENSISREKESFNARRAQVSTCKHDPQYFISFKTEDAKKQPHQPKLKVRERQHGAVTFIFQTQHGVEQQKLFASVSLQLN